MIHLTFQEVEEIARNFNLKLLQMGVAGTSGNFPTGALIKLVYNRPEAEIVLTLDITNYPPNDRIDPPEKYSIKPFDPTLGFHETGEKVIVEVVMTINNMWQAKMTSPIEIASGPITHHEFSKVLFKMIQPFMIAPKALDNLWSMFEDNPNLIEPNKRKNKKTRVIPKS
jgi:hypothetical protein